jgi:hypothetical protein
MSRTENETSGNSIDPKNRPCTCYGSALEPVWENGAETSSIDDGGAYGELLGWRCSKCGHRWPTADRQR